MVFYEGNMNILIDGYNINYKISGNGKNNIVILQGWGTSLAVYDSVANCLSDRYRVVQFDFPGFGDSDEPREAWAVEDYTEFFIKLMTELNIKSATLIGHSYGGRVIIKLCSKKNIPFKIERIVLTDSAGVLPKKTFLQKLKIKKYKFIKKIVNIGFVEKLCPDLINEWRNKQGSDDYRNASPIMRQCLVKAVNEDLTALLPNIKCDTLLIWGDADTATPISDAKIMEEKIPEAGLAVIKGAGHFCFLEQPVLFKNIINSFL